MPGQSKGKGKSKSTPQMGRAAAEAVARDRAEAAAAAAARERAAAETAAGRAGQLQRAEAEKAAAAATAAAAAASAAEKAAVTKRPQSPKPAASLFVRTPTKSNRAKLERRLQATTNTATRAAKRKAVEEGRKAQESYIKKITNQQGHEQRQAEREKSKHEKQLARHAEKSLSMVESRRIDIDPQEITQYNGRRLKKDGSNLNLYNIISESTVDWHDKINNAKLHGITLISSITSWSRKNGYNNLSLAPFGPRKEDLVIEFDDFHFTFHSTPITEGERKGKGAFHVERNNENKDFMVRYFTKDYNPIKFIKSPLRQGKTTPSELKFIDGVYDIINQYEIKGTQKHADTEEAARKEDLLRDTAEQARLAKIEADKAAARARAAASKAKHKKGGTRKNRKSNGKTRKLRR